MTTGKIIALTRWTFVGQVMSLLFSMLSRLVTAFLPRSKRLLISWLQSPSAVILEPKKIKSDAVSTVSHLFPMKWFIFWMLSFKPNFSLSSFTYIKRLFSSSSLSANLICLSDVVDILLEIVIPAFHMMYSAYKLNKQGDNIQLCCTPFLILNQSVVPCPCLTACPTYRFLREQLCCSGSSILLRIFHSLLWSTLC